MRPLEYILNAEGGQIVIEMPGEMQGKKLKVVVMEEEEGEVKKFHELPVKERLRILQQYKGTAKYPDVEINEYDVYEQ